jgi:hypothetical protein
MAIARAIPACALLLLFLGCQNPGPPPNVDRVDPPAYPPSAGTTLHVHGSNFLRRWRVDFGAPDRSDIQSDFAVALVLDTTRTPLADVAWVDATELTATVPPGLAEGVYTLELRDPWTRLARLEQAFTVNREACTRNCDDGRDCTVDSCMNGTCRNIVAQGRCLIDGVCRTRGEVNPTNDCQECGASAVDAWTPRNEQQPCDDRNACTRGERCKAGECGSPVSTLTCPATSTCRLEVCDPLTGACVPEGPAPEGIACDDGTRCTTNDTCISGECRGVADGGCGNTPPLACLTVTPQASAHGTTVTFDASCSRDLEDPTSALQVRFDFQGNGTYTALGPQKTATFPYPATTNVYAASVEVMDTGGLSAYATRFVSVAGSTEEVVVTTSADEDDAGATPQAPGGTGLSLREAIRYVNAGNGRVIRFARAMTLRAAPLPPLTRDTAMIVGEPGTVLDFSLVTSGVAPCLVLAGSGQRLLGLDLHSCPGLTVQLAGVNAQVADSRITRGTGSGTGVELAGTRGQLGPRTEVAGFAGSGVVLRASYNRVEGASIHGNGAAGIEYGTASIANVVIQRNEIYANGGAGITVAASPTTLSAYHNTIDGNGGPGIAAPQSATGITARNNLLTRNGGAGLCGAPNAYVVRDPNGYFANDGGMVCQGSPGAGNVVADPQYLAPSRGDFRLLPGSPMRDAGVDLGAAGADLNGPAPGNYNGPQPDLGANEAP